MPYPAKLGNQM